MAINGLDSSILTITGQMGCLVRDGKAWTYFKWTIYCRTGQHGLVLHVRWPVTPHCGWEFAIDRRLSCQLSTVSRSVLCTNYATSFRSPLPSPRSLRWMGSALLTATKEILCWMSKLIWYRVSLTSCYCSNSVISKSEKHIKWLS